MALNYELLPNREEDKEFISKLQAIVEDRNVAIAKTLGVDVLDDFTIKIFGSASALTGSLFEQEKTFSGYKDGADWIALINPAAANGLFTDLWKECSIITDYALIKYYLCKTFYPKKEDFHLYYKYLSEQLALVLSGKYQEKIANFHLKVHVPGKRYKKEDQIGLILYLIRQQAGVDFIVSHLKIIMDDKDIEKSLNTIYKKSFEEFIKPEILRVREEAKKMEEQFRQNRKKFNLKQMNSQENSRPQGSKYGYSKGPNSSSSNSSNTENKKFVSRAKFNPNKKNDQHENKKSNHFNRENKSKNNFQKNNLNGSNNSQNNSGEKKDFKPRVNSSL